MPSPFDRHGRLHSWFRHRLGPAYERSLRRDIESGPTHVAIIQDGNRRYARSRGDAAPDGHRAGADTTEQVLSWCLDLDIQELTLYAFSTENFNRPAAEREPLFDLIESKLLELAERDQIHDNRVAIRAIGDLGRLPDRVRAAIETAESRTADYDDFRLTVALAYGGRAELLRATREIATAVDDDRLATEEIDVDTVESFLYCQPIRDVDLIIRTGGDERTSNFLPWHANGNEAAAYFCAPYWPAFEKIDFLRAIRTYESRAASWQQTTVERAATLVGAVAATELADARAASRRLIERLPTADQAIEAELADAASNPPTPESQHGTGPFRSPDESVDPDSAD